MAITKVTVDDNRIRVDKILFTDKNLLVLRSAALENDIALIKEGENNFRALLMRCTHRNYALSSSGNSLVCSAHGSRFDFNGLVTRGPASNPLQRFPVSDFSDHVVIHIK